MSGRPAAIESRPVGRAAAAPPPERTTASAYARRRGRAGPSGASSAMARSGRTPLALTISVARANGWMSAAFAGRSTR